MQRGREANKSFGTRLSDPGKDILFFDMDMEQCALRGLDRLGIVQIRAARREDHLFETKGIGTAEQGS